MPKIVDHDARRREIVAAVWRLISREGVTAATTRNIAREARCAKGILSHYFADRAELLNDAVLHGYRRTEFEILDCLKRVGGLEALRQVLLLTLALNDEKLLANQVELAFWGLAVGNRKLTRDHYESYESFRTIVRRLLVEARKRGEISTASRIDGVADVLVAVIDGIGMQAALFPEVFPPARQRAAIDDALAALAGRDALRSRRSGRVARAGAGRRRQR